MGYKIDDVAHIGSLSAVYIVFFINRAGHFFRMIQPVTFWLNPYHGWWNYALDGFWLSLVLKIAGQDKQWGRRRALIVAGLFA